MEVVLDSIIRGRIQNRILRLSSGNFGDYKILQQGICELRLHFGAGYRIYFGNNEKMIVVLLSGGDKSSQEEDVEKAIEYWKEYKEDKDG